jgi:hypothetical protein
VVKRGRRVRLTNSPQSVSRLSSLGLLLTSALDGGQWSASRPFFFTPGKRITGNSWIRGWLGPRTSLHGVEKQKLLTLSGFEPRPLGPHARSQPLLRNAAMKGYKVRAPLLDIDSRDCLYVSFRNCKKNLDSLL